MKSNHLDGEVIERFGVQQLPRTERKIVYKHLFQCETCRRKIVDSRREAAGLLALAVQLMSEKAVEPDHLNYPLIENYVENKLSTADKEIVRSHLEVCRACSVEVDDFTQSLIVMRNAGKPQRDISDSRISWRILQGISVRHVTVEVLVVLLITSLSMVIWRELSKRAAQPQIGQELAHPKSSASNEQITPNLVVDAPAQVTAERELIALNDGVRKVVVTPNGGLEGLGRVSNSDQKAIAHILVTGQLEKPAIIKTLRTAPNVLRGETDSQLTIKVVSPKATVMLDDTPTFQWRPVDGARAYQVLVGDENFHKAADSGLIDARSTEWRPQRRLDRGIVYTWVVKTFIGNAGVNDAVRTSSNSKFTILREEKVVQLNHLKATNRSHLELGVFYLREGLIDLAEREFRILSRQNPRSRTLKRALVTIRSWK